MCQDGVLGDWVLLLRLTQCPVPRAASEVARGAAGPAQSPLWGMLQEGGGAGLQRGSLWERGTVRVSGGVGANQGKMRLCAFSPTSSWFCCEVQLQQPAPGPLEELRQMSLRKNKYLRDEFPSIAESIRRGLVPCVFQRSPSDSCRGWTVSGRSCGPGVGKV